MSDSIEVRTATLADASEVVRLLALLGHAHAFYERLGYTGTSFRFAKTIPIADTRADTAR